MRHSRHGKLCCEVKNCVSNATDRSETTLSLRFTAAAVATWLHVASRAAEFCFKHGARTCRPKYIPRNSSLICVLPIQRITPKRSMHISMDFQLLFAQATRVREVLADEEILNSQQFQSAFSPHFDNVAYPDFHFYVPYVVADLLFFHMKTIPDETEVDPGNHVVISKALTKMIDTSLQNEQSQGHSRYSTPHIIRFRLDFESTGSCARGDSTAHFPGGLFRFCKPPCQRGVVCMDNLNSTPLEIRFSMEPAKCRYDELGGSGTMDMEIADCAK